MKSFYQMLKILESEQVKTPGGRILTPEELEDYENEKSPMYKALFLKDIDEKRKAEEERSPERVAAKEQEKLAREKKEEEWQKQREQEKINKLEKKEEPKTLREKYDYIIKVSGVLVKNLQNTPVSGVLASLGIKKDNNNFKLKTHAGNFVIEPYDGPIGSPEQDRDYEFIQHALGLLVLEWREFAGIGMLGWDGRLEKLHINKELQRDLEKTLEKIGATKIGKIGEKYIFDGRYHDTSDDIRVGDKIVVASPGWEMKTDRGTLVLSKANVEAA